MVYGVLVQIDRDAAQPPYRQLAAMFRDEILAGKRAPGSRLPSITALVQEYGIGRNTAVHVYEALQQEGLVETVQGWGSSVADPLPSADAGGDDSG